MVMDEALAQLEAAGRDVGARWLSLAPGREHAAPLSQLEMSSRLEVELRVAVARGLGSIARAVARHFPENLFCDLEVLGRTLEVAAARDGARGVDEIAGAIVDLHEIFGVETPIRFRYVHDFLYGFDWARWVRRDPGVRAGVGPFDRAFLAHSRRRAEELAGLIANGDAKYGALPATGEYRNPFPFSRDPESERVLLRDLARRGWIPVEAWRADLEPRWDRPYQEERERRARELGFGL
jgi:hypothetical protein